MNDCLFCRLQLDFNAHARGEFEFHKGVDSFRRSVVDVDETLVRRKLELFTRLFVHECGAVDGEDAFVRTRFW